MANYDVSKYVNMKPSEVRALIRSGKVKLPTAGMCAGYAQANLTILPAEYAADFKEYANSNPFPVPILEIVDGSPLTRLMAKDGNVLTDIPEYFIYRDGAFSQRVYDTTEFWQDGYVGFLIGCSFSFEEALMTAGIEMRHIATGRIVPMYKTNIMTQKRGPFEGPMVVSMRPMSPEHAKIACEITAAMPNVHGAPIHIGDASEIGISDISKPDYGEAVEIREGEVTVFWPCGVTPQVAINNAKLPIAITHSPGHMFITDILNTKINALLEAQK
ncbi:MAG: putative hydro-lyase [Oscillospiraceae bacterium]|nr:putative hydro-lyase [Oscillospiraceae bacterium]